MLRITVLSSLRRSQPFLTNSRQFGGCGGGSAPPTKAKSVLKLFKSIGAGKKDAVEKRTKSDPHARALLGLSDDEDYQVGGNSHGEHARAIESDLRAKLLNNNHGHSHDGHSDGDDDHGHGHSHDGHGHSHDGHGHSHGNEKPRKISIEESEDDFVEMWNPNAPNGPEHGGPRGPEPTRYGQEWEKKGRVSDFT